MKISPARTAAFDVLFRIETEKAFSSALLPVFEDKLAANDRGLCHEIALGVLRRKLYLDRLIDELSKGRKLDVEVRIALQIGLFQMIFLDRIPPHPAINESVELVSRAKKTSAKSFVNALLRSYQRTPVEPSYGDEIEKISISTSHPRWLVERWISQFGFDEAGALCEANNHPPTLTFRVVGSEREKRDILADLMPLEKMRPSGLVDGCFVVEKMSEKLAFLSEASKIYFQDEGSQLVANAVIAEGGSQILDVCAAPGGKTTMIASGDEKNVVAGDVYFPRVQYLRETCAKHEAASVSVVQYDAETMIPFEPASF
ncbi:MAG TPA: transcription antitermination factor NusB, partial [Pyrinomonadaceae bacterium]|nr:transcription antitermination factor NusB [Pyrinomonadaceae bacterium]